MKIEQIDITVGDLVAGYHDDGEGGVVGYHGRLDIRPPYQREFIYKGEQRRAVITSILDGFPLNVMYWADREDGTYEVIDGQQRSISIGQYHNSDFSLNAQYFHSLDADQKEDFLNYKLMVYLCSGTYRDKIRWFKTVNIAGEKLYDQEIRNAVHSGPWVSDAKGWFSKTGCPAAGLGGDYLSGSPNRQDYLETVIRWISGARTPEAIDDYMSRHQRDKDAKPLWEYFRDVIDWTEATFIKKRAKIMKGIDWGLLYNAHKDDELDPAWLEREVKRLILDDDVTSQRGIYPYLLTGEEKHLNIRAFTDRMKLRAYERQGGKCLWCGNEFDLSDMHGDHIKPWSEGGRTIEENCQMLCRPCNRKKGKQ